MPIWETENLFAGTAWYYARYRPHYPEEVFILLKKKFNRGLIDVLVRKSDNPHVIVLNFR